MIDVNPLNELTQTPWFKKWQQEWLDWNSRGFLKLKPIVDDGAWVETVDTVVFRGKRVKLAGLVKAVIQYDPKSKPITRKAVDAEFRVAKKDFLKELKKRGYLKK